MLHTVHVRVNDAATGQPTPVRIRFTDADGQYYAPFGRLTEFATGWGQDVGGNLQLGAKKYAYIDGTCEIALPPGKITAEIHKGPEYRPVVEEVDQPAGKMAMRFQVERWIDMGTERWYSGDVRAHFMSPHAALLAGAAEDLAVVNLLACATPPTPRQPGSVSNILAFSGQAPALETPGHVVVVNTMNRHPLLGSVALLNCHRIVYPLTFGGPDERDDWSLADWCEQCHRKQGLVVWVRTHHQAAEFVYGEPLADLILGKIDAFEIEYFEDSVFDVLSDWYRLLACGFRVPLVGGSGKDTNQVALGSMRTYACLAPGESLCYHNWIEALRAGRTFATNGPLLSFSVNGQDAGAVVRAEAGVPVRVRAAARSWLPLDRLEVLANGTVIAEATATGSPATATIEMDWVPPLSCWLAARCQGSQRLPQRPASQCVFAHSSPVYIDMGQQPRPAAFVVTPLLRELDAMGEWAKTLARCDDDRQRQKLVGIFQSAREELARRAEALPVGSPLNLP